VGLVEGEGHGPEEGGEGLEEEEDRYLFGEALGRVRRREARAKESEGW
jgi:hypothetical protein